MAGLFRVLLPHHSPALSSKYDPQYVAWGDGAVNMTDA